MDNVHSEFIKADQLLNEYVKRTPKFKERFIALSQDVQCFIDVEIIDTDHDAGDYASDGGDYIKLLDWLEETGRSYPIRIHSMNPVGVENMRRVIERNHWVEVR